MVVAVGLVCNDIPSIVSYLDPFPHPPRRMHNVLATPGLSAKAASMVQANGPVTNAACAGHDWHIINCVCIHHLGICDHCPAACWVFSLTCDRPCLGHHSGSPLWHLCWRRPLNVHHTTGCDQTMFKQACLHPGTAITEHCPCRLAEQQVVAPRTAVTHIHSPQRHDHADNTIPTAMVSTPHTAAGCSSLCMLRSCCTCAVPWW
jgi:hypothetical protein